MKPLRTALAPGKVVLVGEYAVVDGGPGIVMAVDRGVRCDVYGGTGVEPGIETPNGDPRFVEAALGDAPQRERFVFSDWNPTELADKPGFGGSAAACVAACVAVERPATEAYALHAEAQGGGSGIDVAASIYGGLLLFERKRIMPMSPVKPVIVYSGTSAKTGPRVERYLAWPERERFVRAARRIVYRFLEAPMAAMADYRALLEEMVAQADLHYWTDGLREICALADEHGGIAKPSGAGGGDCVVSLFPSSLHRMAFADDCTSRGFAVVDANITDGARLEEVPTADEVTPRS